MAGLNDDVDDDLNIQDLDNPDQPDPDLIQVSMVQELNVSDPVREPTNDELFGIGAVKGEVPNINVQLKLVQEKIDNALELIDIKSKCISVEAICAADAAIINSVSPGFLNENRPLGFFTQDPSRTMLNETLNAISTSTDTAVLKTSVVLNEVLDTTIAAFEKVLKSYEGVVEKTLNRLVSSKAIALSKLSDSSLVSYLEETSSTERYEYPYSDVVELFELPTDYFVIARNYYKFNPDDEDQMNVLVPVNEEEKHFILKYLDQSSYRRDLTGLFLTLTREQSTHKLNKMISVIDGCVKQLKSMKIDVSNVNKTTDSQEASASKQLLDLTKIRSDIAGNMLIINSIASAFEFLIHEAVKIITKLDAVTEQKS